MIRKDVVFYIPYPNTKRGKTDWNSRYSLNAYMGRKNHYARVKDVNEIHDLVFYCLKKDHVKKAIFNTPVEINFYWQDGLDIDNHSALGKMIVDALKGYIIKNDSPKYFKKVSHEFWDGNTIKVVVKEHEENLPNL